MSEEMDGFDFDDYQPKQTTVSYQGQKYILREATESVAVAYRNAKMKGSRLNKDRTVTMEGGIGDAAPLLVSKCLHHAVKGPGGELAVGSPVQLQTVLAWPSKIVRPLYEWIKDASDLHEHDEDEDKEKGHERNGKMEKNCESTAST